MNHEALQILARSVEWQSIYARAKDIGNLQLFNNNKEFTKAQIWMLYYLEVYYSLYSDLNMGEDWISEEVIKDTLRTEAYLLMKNEERKKRNKSSNKDDKKSMETSSGGLPSIKFVSREKK